MKKQSIYQKADKMHYLTEKIAELAKDLPMSEPERDLLRHSITTIAVQAICIKHDFRPF